MEEYVVIGPDDGADELVALLAGSPYKLVARPPRKISDDPLLLVVLGRQNDRQELAYLRRLGLITFADLQAYDLVAAWRLVCLSHDRPDTAAHLFAAFCDIMHKRQLDFADTGCGQPLPTHIWKDRFGIRLPIATCLWLNGVVSVNILVRLQDEDLDFLEHATDYVRRIIRELRDSLRQP